MDMSDYKTSNSTGFIYVFILIHNFSKNAGGIPLKSESRQKLTDESRNNLKY